MSTFDIFSSHKWERREGGGRRGGRRREEGGEREGGSFGAGRLLGEEFVRKYERGEGREFLLLELNPKPSLTLSEEKEGRRVPPKKDRREGNSSATPQERVEK